MVTGEIIAPSKYTDMYVVKTHRHRAALESDYFIKMIEICETKRDEEIRRIEEGIEEVEGEGISIMHASRSDVGGFTEWEKINLMPDSDYLMRTLV